MKAQERSQRPLLLDLFCGAGGAAMGYYRAGFDVVGVDIKRQKNYPFPFVQGDALRPPFDLSKFDAIHASPPCQHYSIAAQWERMKGVEYKDLVADTRSLLKRSEKPFVIENTPGAPLRADLILCGSMFGLQLVRHRVFEIGFDLFCLLPRCEHHPDPITVCGHGTPSWVRARRGQNYKQAEKRAAMGIDWTNRGELAQAIPPAYTEFIGKYLREEIGK